MMKKPVLSIHEPEPKKALRAIGLLLKGSSRLSMVISNQNFSVDAAQESSRKLKSAYPMLKIEIYHAANKIRTLLS